MHDILLFIKINNARHIKIGSGNFRDRTKLMLPLDLARLRVYEFFLKVHLPFKINCISFLEHRLKFFQKKILDTHFIPLQNELSPIAV